MASRSQSIDSSRTNATSSARFRRPSASSTSISPGKWRSPLPSPWVSDAAQKPPLRPLAPEPTRSASSTTTRSEGSVSSRRIAAHRPVNPPPTIATSTVPWPRSGSRGPPGSAVVNQKLPPAGALAARGIGGIRGVEAMRPMYADWAAIEAAGCVIRSIRADA